MNKQNSNGSHLNNKQGLNDKQGSNNSISQVKINRNMNRQITQDKLLNAAIQEQDKREKLNQKEKDLEQFQKRLNQNKKVIDVLNIDITLLKDQISVYESKRIEFLKTILKKGEDCRNGLHWIIYSLVKKGQKIEKSMFPDWLDEKAFMFIVQRYQMEHQIKQMKEIQIFILDLYKTNQQTQEITQQVQQNLNKKYIVAAQNISIIENNYYNI